MCLSVCVLLFPMSAWFLLLSVLLFTTSCYCRLLLFVAVVFLETCTHVHLQLLLCIQQPRIQQQHNRNFKPFVYTHMNLCQSHTYVFQVFMHTNTNDSLLLHPVLYECTSKNISKFFGFLFAC